MDTGTPEIAVYFRDGVRSIQIQSSETLRDFYTDTRSLEFPASHYSAHDYDSIVSCDRINKDTLELAYFLQLDVYPVLLMRCTLEQKFLPKPYCDHLFLARRCIRDVVADKTLFLKWLGLGFKVKSLLTWVACAKYNLRKYFDDYNVEHIDLDFVIILHSACENGSFDVVQHLCRSVKSSDRLQERLKRLDKKHQSLTLAATRNHMNIVRFLCTNLGYPANHGDSIAFRKTAEKGHLEIMKYLYLQGANVRACNDEAWTASVRLGCLDTVRWLVDVGRVPITALNDYVFRRSLMNGHLLVFQYAISFREPGFIRLVSNRYWLLDSVVKGGAKIEILRYLYTSGVALLLPNYENGDLDSNGEYLIDYVLANNRLDVLEFLRVECGYSWMQFTTQNLFSLFRFADLETISWLYDRGYELNLENDLKDIYDWIIERDRCDILQWLCAHYPIKEKSFWEQLGFLSKLSDSHQVRGIIDKHISAFQS